MRWWGHPQLLAFAIAIPLAAGVLTLGQASENETRARLREAQIDGAMRTASVISNSYADRVSAIQNTLVTLALTPRSDASPIALAVQRGDNATLQAIADTVLRLHPRSVIRSYIAVRAQAENLVDATIVAASPTGSDLIGRRLSDLRGPASAALLAIVGRRETAEFGFLTDDYPGDATTPATFDIAATIPGPGRTLRSQGLATIVTEIDDGRTFSEAAAPYLAAGDDAYLVMLEPSITGNPVRPAAAMRPLIGRVRGSAPYPWLDLAPDTFVQLLGTANFKVARAEALDPLGAGTRLIASTPLSMTTGYSIVLSRDTSAVDREVNAALSQLAGFRAALVAMLLALAFLSGLVVRRLRVRAADQERLRLARDLHDLLGHSLSLITIKSQLARRVLARRDIGSAALEIADIERTARESLDDVRQAVVGYRQPSLSSALASAQVALAAAGIDGTVEGRPGPLPNAVDVVLAWAVREGVTNVIRHSGAGACRIRISRHAHEARLEIVDDGRITVVNSAGHGLRGLEERAKARGGHTDAGPLPEGGFKLQVWVPL